MSLDFLKIKNESVEKFLTAAPLVMACVMGLTASFSFALFNIGVVVLIAAFFIRRIRARDARLFDPWTDIAVLVYYGAAILSCTQSQYGGMSAQGLHKLGRYLLLFIAVRELAFTETSIKRLTGFLIGGGVLAAVDALIQLWVGVDPLKGQTPVLSMTDLIRLTGPFANPNAFAIYLCFIIPLAAALWLADWKRARGTVGLALAGMLVAIAFTYSRPAATALLATGLLFTVVNRAYWIPLAGLLLGAAGLFFAPPAVKTWLSGLGSWQNFFYDTSRNFHHLAAWNMIHHSPWLGVGINTFDVNYQHFKLAEDPITRWSAHQAYLQIWAETGILGLASFCLVVFGMVKSWFKAQRLTRHLFVRPVLLGMMGGVLAFLIISFFESSLWQPRQTYFFWFFAGILCGISKWTVRHESK